MHCLTRYHFHFTSKPALYQVSPADITKKAADSISPFEYFDKKSAAGGSGAPLTHLRRYALCPLLKGEFCAGEWCRFCKARYTCRKRSEYHMRLAERDFKQPDLLTDDEIADILPVAESLNSWVQDLMAYATQEAVDGKHWPGYKLVAGRTVRKYTSEAEVIKAATDAGYSDIYKTTLLGVGDLEKRLGRKKFSEVLGKYVVKPQGAPTLVPETDPRKPYSDAAGDFKE